MCRTVWRTGAASACLRRCAIRISSAVTCAAVIASAALGIVFVSAKALVCARRLGKVVKLRMSADSLPKDKGVVVWLHASAHNHLRGRRSACGECAAERPPLKTSAPWSLEAGADPGRGDACPRRKGAPSDRGLEWHPVSATVAWS